MLPDLGADVNRPTRATQRSPLHVAVERVCALQFETRLGDALDAANAGIGATCWNVVLFSFFYRRLGRVMSLGEWFSIGECVGRVVLSRHLVWLCCVLVIDLLLFIALPFRRLVVLVGRRGRGRAGRWHWQQSARHGARATSAVCNRYWFRRGHTAFAGATLIGDGASVSAQT